MTGSRSPSLRKTPGRSRARNLLTRELCRAWFEVFPLPLGVYDQETLRFLDVNPAAVDTYGYSRQEWLQKTLLDLCADAETQRLLEDVRAQPTLEYSGVAWHRLQGGKIVPVKMTLQTLKIDKYTVGLMTIHEMGQGVSSAFQGKSFTPESSEYAVVITDARGYIEGVSQAYLKMIGYRLEEVLGRRPGDLARSGEQSAAFYREMWETILSGQVWTGELINRRKEGSLYLQEMTILPVIDAEGNVTHFVGVVQDTSWRKQIEQALRQSEERYRTLVEQLPGVVYLDLLDGKGTTLFVSPQIESLLGVSVAEWMQGGLSVWMKVIHPDDRQRVIEAYLQACRSGQPCNLEYRVITPQGQLRWIQENEHLLKTEDGTLLVQGIMFDITERKRAEQALQESERMLREAQRIAGLGSYMLDIPSGVWQSSEMLDQIFGIDASYPHTVQGWLDRVHPHDRERMSRYFQEEVLGRGQPFDATYRILRASDGEERLVHGLGRLEFDAGGRPVRMYGTIQDITEQNRQQRLVEAQAMLARALAETHDLQTLLEHVLEAASHAIPVAEKGSILLREADGRLRIRALIGYHDPRLRDFAFASDSGYSARAARLRQPLILSDVRADAEIRYDGEIEEARQILSAIAVPLIVNEQVIGVISLDSTRRNAFRQEDLQQLSTFATIAALLLERVRLFHELSRRVVELEMLYESGLALSQILRPHEIGQKLIRLLAQRMNWHHTTVRLYHPDQDRFEVLAFNLPGLEALDEEEIKRRFQQSVSRPGEGLSGWAFQQGQIICLGDVTSDPHYLETFPGIRSGLYVPIQAGRRKLGVLSIESTEPNAFDESDRRLAATLATQAAIALENARLFEEIRQRAMEQEVIYRASQALLMAHLEQRAICQAIHQAVEQLMPCEAFVIVLAGNEGEAYQAVYLYDLGQEYPPQSVPWGQGLSGKVISEGQAILIPDTQQMTVPGLHFGSQEPIRSILAVPLRVGERVIGMVSAQSYQSQAFTERHRVLLETLAAQMAVVLENARLFEEARRRVRELETMNRLSVALRAISRVEEMLAVVLEETLHALNVSVGSIYLLEEQRGILIPIIARGWLADLSERAIWPGEGIVGTVFERGEPYLSPEFTSDPLALSEPREHLPRGWGGVCVPIHSFEKTLGAMVIAVPADRRLTDNEVRLLSTLAEMTGNALHRMRLYESTRQQAEEFAALYEVNLRLSQQHDLNSLLQVIVDTAANLIQADAAGVYLYEPHDQVLEMIVSSSETMPVGTRLRLGEGLSGRVAERRQPMRLENYALWEHRAEAFENMSIRAALAVPMLFGGELIGVLIVHEVAPSSRIFSEQDERLLSLLATQAAAAVRSTRLHLETERRLQHLQALREVDRAISASLDLHLILNTVLSHVLSQLGVDAADILLFNPLQQTLDYAAGLGFRTPIIQKTALRLGEGQAGRAALERCRVFLPNLRDGDAIFTRTSLVTSEGFQAYGCVPLLSKGDLKGVLEVFHRSPLAAQAEWLSLLETLAGQAAIAIDNSQMFERMQRNNAELSLAYETTLEGWARAMTLRDNETEEHTRRVADMAVALAQAMGLSQEEIVHIRRGALLHDIGKIGVPDSILLKAGPLTEEEQAIMRRHPLLAYEMLRPIPYLRRALDIPYYHHERWDGSGYPLGLKGEQIPLAARIFAVVDVFDALTSDRPYRKAWPIEQALDYLRQESGKTLDPQVVEVFLRWFESQR